MSHNSLEKTLFRITKLQVFQDVLQEIRSEDSLIAENLEITLRERLKLSANIISNASGNDYDLRYGLYRQAKELQSDIIGPHRRLTETMAQREKALWNHAFNCTERFFQDVTISLGTYFDNKLEAMEKEIIKDASWYSGIIDTVKKSGHVVNYGKKTVAKIANSVSDGIMSEEDALDCRSVEKRVWENHLSQNDVTKDIEEILVAATQKYSEAWQKIIEEQTSGIRNLSAFASIGGEQSTFNVDFKIGAAEGTLLVGIGGAIAGSIGLAAGWHTITYALVNVFPPAAAFAAVAAILVGVLTKESAKKARLDAIRKAVEQYFKTLLTLVNTEKIKRLHNKTLRESMYEESKRIIKSTAEQWTRAICGNVSMEVYSKFLASADEQLLLINDVLRELDETIATTEKSLSLIARLRDLAIRLHLMPGRKAGKS